MRWTIRKKLMAGFGLALAILIIMGAVSYRSMVTLLETATWLTHTHEVLTKLESVISLMKDVETGQRGYLITGEARYLEPYDTAISEVERVYEEVKDLTRDNPVQQRRLDLVMPLIEKKFAELRETIELRKGVGFEAALEVVMTNRGKTIMDDIRVVIGAMKEEERRLLSDRTVAAQANARNTQVVILVSTVGAFFLLLVVTGAIARSITGRISEIAGVAKRIAQGDTDQTIPPSPTQDEIADLAQAFNIMTVKRRQVEKELQESEQRFRLMVSEVKDYAIIMLDPSGRVKSWNEGAQHIKGYAAKEILGDHFSRFFSAEENEAGKPAEMLRVAALEGRFEDEGWRVREDGTQFSANVILTALRDRNGVLVGFSKVTRDITARK
ncbi:MAG: CHASE3 domain-containing protein, partial [Dehalococcoidia bacterium]